MRSLFNIDSFLMRFLTKVADMMILNIFFLVTCIPVFTAGASMTALHYVTLRMASGGGRFGNKSPLSIFQAEFPAGNRNLAYPYGFACLLTCDICSTWNGESYINTAVKVVSVIACAVLVMILFYVFAI